MLQWCILTERLTQRTSFHLFTTFHLFTAFHLFTSFNIDNTASSVLIHKILTILHFFHLQQKRWKAVAIFFGPSLYLYCWRWEHSHNVFGRRLNVPASLLMVHWGLQQPSLLPVFYYRHRMDIFCPHWALSSVWFESVCAYINCKDWLSHGKWHQRHFFVWQGCFVRSCITSCVLTWKQKTTLVCWFRDPSCVI